MVHCSTSRVKAVNSLRVLPEAGSRTSRLRILFQSVPKPATEIRQALVVGAGEKYTASSVALSHVVRDLNVDQP